MTYRSHLLSVTTLVGAGTAHTRISTSGARLMEVDSAGPSPFALVERRYEFWTPFLLAGFEADVGRRFTLAAFLKRSLKDRTVEHAIQLAGPSGPETLMYRLRLPETAFAVRLEFNL